MYTQQEPLAGAAQDRVVSILTLQNMCGGAGGALVLIVLTRILDITGPLLAPLWFLQSCLVLGGAIIGTLVTLRWGGGLSTWDRLVLLVFYRMRRLHGGHRVQPHDHADQPAQATTLTLVDSDGVVIAQPYQPGGS